MSDTPNSTPSSVTLIFYRLGPLTKEPLLNILASAMQMSSLCHCEVAIGESVGCNGEMVNVARIFNDSVGVELARRTGRNPQYSYLQLGCSQLAVRNMLDFARAQVGKPFSQVAMARSIVYPRTSDYNSWYCAELTAAILQVGGLLNSQSNPGAATPASLHATYKSRAAVTANPFKIHMLQQHASVRAHRRSDSHDSEPLLQLQLRGALRPHTPQAAATHERVGRQHFKQLAHNEAGHMAQSVRTTPTYLTLYSLGQR